MAKNTVTLTLEGERLEQDDFVQGAILFRDLVRALSKQHARGKSIRWMLDELQRGSAVTVVRGVETKGDFVAVENVIRGYEHVGRAMKLGHVESLPRLTRRPVRGLMNLINGHVTSIKLETESQSFLIGPEQAENSPETTSSYGEIRGLVEAMSKRRTLRFALYDVNYDVPVSCYLKPGNEEIMRKVWGKTASVRGIVIRDTATGAPLAVRDIESVRNLEDEEKNLRHFREALGAVEDSGVSSEEIIRKLRNG